MLAKRILAGFFAGAILLKLIIWIISPNLWMGAEEVFLGHTGLVMIIYLGLIALTGYFIFSTLDMIDIAVVMLFASLLLGISILPYSSAMLALRGEIMSIGWGKAWLAVLIWGALAVLVLYKVLAPSREQLRK
jgi:hypothetical protein